MIAGQKQRVSLKLHDGVEKNGRNIGDELLLVKEHIVNSWEREKVWVRESILFTGYGVNKIKGGI